MSSTDSIRGAIVIVNGDRRKGAAACEDLKAKFEETYDVLVAGDRREAANLLAARGPAGHVKTQESRLDPSLHEFLAATAGGIMNEAGLDDALSLAVECIRGSLRPLGTHVRLLERRSNSLVKRKGFGPYHDLAPEHRQLQYDGIGSVNVANTRKGHWETRAKMAGIRELIGRELSPAEETKLRRIAAYSCLPLTSAGRILGTLSVHFEDGSLSSPAKRGFVEAMASALGAMLGSLERVREREAVVRYARDVGKVMFTGPLRQEKLERETSVLTQITRAVYQLTSAEVVAYYRFQPQEEELTLVVDAMQGRLPAGTKLPEKMPFGAGVLSMAIRNRAQIRVDDCRKTEWSQVRDQKIDSCPEETWNRFYRWLGSEIAQPMFVDDRVDGVLLAASSLPKWFDENDWEVIRAFALKLSLWLGTMKPPPVPDWGSEVENSLNKITAKMARTWDEDILYRLLLLAMTSGDCLGFSRAILFRRQGGDGYTFVATEAVGAQSGEIATTRWNEADETPFEEQIEECAKVLPKRSGDLRELLPFELDLQQDQEIFQSLKERRTVVHRRGDPHLLRNERVLDIFSQGSTQDGDYVLTALFSAGRRLTGVVLADRAFLGSTDVAEGRIATMHFLTGHFEVILGSLELMANEHVLARELVRGIGYSLRTWAAVLSARLSNFAYSLGGKHQEAIAGLKDAVEFFGKAGTRAAKIERLEEVRPGVGEKLDLNQVLLEMEKAISDARIQLNCADNAVVVLAERRYIDDMMLEVLWNACNFAPKDTGVITVTVRAEEGMARVDCADNGPGIHPELRPDLFKPFKCNPSTRMGLGLFYAERLARAYGGTIQEIGSSQQGAHFVLRIPLAKGRQDESG